MSDAESIPDETLDGLIDEVQEAAPEQPATDDEAAEAPGETADKKTVKPKRVIRNPRPKLNEETLKTPRGLPAIEKCFERVKFKGKGHEDKDLDVLLKTYEYWCHRMFPKYPFDDCIEKLEKLGTKRATQVYLKRIRMGIADNDNNSELDSDKEDENVPTDGFVDQFDRVASQPTLNEEEMERIRRNREQAEEKRRQRLEENIRNAESSSEQGLTSEQMERIRINKENAEKLRKKRLQSAEVTQDQILEDVENDPTPIQRHRLQTSSSEEEEAEETTAPDRNETIVQIHAEPVKKFQFNQTEEDISDEDPLPNRKCNRSQVLHSDEEMEETPCRSNTKISPLDRNDSSVHLNEIQTQPKSVLENQEEVTFHSSIMDQIVTDVGNSTRKKSHVNSDEEIEETHITNDTGMVVKTKDRIENSEENHKEGEEVDLNEISDYHISNEDMDMA